MSDINGRMSCVELEGFLTQSKSEMEGHRSVIQQCIFIVCLNWIQKLAVRIISFKFIDLKPHTIGTLSCSFWSHILIVVSPKLVHIDKILFIKSRIGLVSQGTFNNPDLNIATDNLCPTCKCNLYAQETKIQRECCAMFVQSNLRPTLFIFSVVYLKVHKVHPV